MQKILATALIALWAAIGLPGAAHAGGPTSVLVTQPGEAAGALYYDDEAYDALVDLLPTEETRGEPAPPGGAGADYNLTWMVHDVMPWRFDRVRVAADGAAWVSTTFSADSTAGWEPVVDAEELAALLAAVLERGAAPDVVSPAPDAAPAATTPASPEASDSSWFSLSGWRWVVPGALLGLLVGLLVGAVAARRRDEPGPRQVLLTSES